MTGVLADLVSTDTADIVTLLTSELVTNAFVHTGAPSHLTVRILEDVVRVEVVDPDNRLPTPRDPAAHSSSGRGLLIVQALAVRWGVDPIAPAGKCVWFEVRRVQSAA